MTSEYVKTPPLGEFSRWTEREFEAVERAINEFSTSRWDDLRFPATSINPAGLTDGAVPVNSLTTYPGALNFANGATNVCAGVIQMPHAWKIGTAIKPHIHWTQTTADTGEVDWEFFYRIIGNVGDVAGAWLGPFDDTVQVGNQAIANSHILSSFPEISMTGYTESCMIAWYIRRNGASDANAQDALLLEFDVHYQSLAGSIYEYPTNSPYNAKPGAGSLVVTGYAPNVTKA